jgi:hypothetical protein
MATVVLVIVIGFFAVRFLLAAVSRVRSGTKKVKANAHWFWITAAVVLAVSFASYHRR